MRHLPSVVEAVICALDPSEPELRKGCLRASTRALHELVKRYPMVSFHQVTQRYAVGTVDAVIIIYDLRTATKWRILNGHTKALSALAFLPSGDTLASFSAEERCAKAWKAGSSGMLGGILGIQGRCLSSVQLPPLAGEDVKSPRASVGKVLRHCKLKWVSKTTVRLTRQDGSAYNVKLL
jgi:WD40 repeat protein